MLKYKLAMPSSQPFYWVEIVNERGPNCIVWWDSLF